MNKIIFFWFALNIFFVPALKADFSYFPLQIILTAPEGQGEAHITFYNPTPKPIRLQLSFSEWDIDEISKIKILERTELINYIKATPQQFTLAPQEEKNIRITCLLPSIYDDKEYKLFLNILEIGQDRKAANISEIKNFVNKQISAGTYIRKGNSAKLKANLKIKDITVKKDKNNFKYEVVYENTGPTHSREPIQAKFFGEQEKMLAEKNLGFLLVFPTDPNKPRTSFGEFSSPSKESIKTIDFSFPISGLNQKVELK